jgi:hypothetical protein
MHVLMYDESHIKLSAQNIPYLCKYHSRPIEYESTLIIDQLIGACVIQ